MPSVILIFACLFMEKWIFLSALIKESGTQRKQGVDHQTVPIFNIPGAFQLGNLNYRISTGGFLKIVPDRGLKSRGFLLRRDARVTFDAAIGSADWWKRAYTNSRWKDHRSKRSSFCNAELIAAGSYVRQRLFAPRSSIRRAQYLKTKFVFEKGISVFI